MDIIYYRRNGRRDNSVSVATRLRAGDPGFVPGRCWHFFQLATASLWGAPSLLSNGYWGTGSKATGAWSWPLTSI